MLLSCLPIYNKPIISSLIRQVASYVTILVTIDRPNNTIPYGRCSAPVGRPEIPPVSTEPFDLDARNHQINQQLVPRPVSNRKEKTAARAHGGCARRPARVWRPSAPRELVGRPRSSPAASACRPPQRSSSNRSPPSPQPWPRLMHHGVVATAQHHVAVVASPAWS